MTHGREGISVPIRERKNRKKVLGEGDREKSAKKWANYSKNRRPKAKSFLDWVSPKSRRAKKRQWIKKMPESLGRSQRRLFHDSGDGGGK